jgi:hypothetical protein
MHAHVGRRGLQAPGEAVRGIKVTFDDREAARHVGEPTAIGTRSYEDGDGAPLLHEQSRQVRPDKTGGARQKDPHRKVTASAVQHRG